MPSALMMFLCRLFGHRWHHVPGTWIDACERCAALRTFQPRLP